MVQSLLMQFTRYPIKLSVPSGLQMSFPSMSVTDFIKFHSISARVVDNLEENKELSRHVTGMVGVPHQEITFIERLVNVSTCVHALICS